MIRFMTDKLGTAVSYRLFVHRSSIMVNYVHNILKYVYHDKYWTIWNLKSHHLIPPTNLKICHCWSLLHFTRQFNKHWIKIQFQFFQQFCHEFTLTSDCHQLRTVFICVQPKRIEPKFTWILQFFMNWAIKISRRNILTAREDEDSREERAPRAAEQKCERIVLLRQVSKLQPRGASGHVAILYGLALGKYRQKGLDQGAQ